MPYSPPWRPQPLLRVAEPFDHEDWVYELKHDGFRALAVIERRTCRLISRNGYTFPQWPALCQELVNALRSEHAVLDGEVTCIRPDGTSDFDSLMFRRIAP